MRQSTLKKESFWATERKRIIKHKSIIWFLLPAFLLAFLFGYVPMIGIIISFREKYNIIRYSPIEAFTVSTWSLEHFAAIFKDASILTSIKNTLIISFLKILIVFPLTVLLAILLSEIKKKFLSMLILIILCIPHFLSWSVVIGIWSNLLNEINGAINNILVNTGIIKESFWFFGSNAWFKPLAVFLAAWKSIGWSSIIFYAAIMAIDKSFYEAATIDGATKIQKTIHLTIPTIMPTIALMLVMNFAYIMDAGFEQIFAMMTDQTRYSQQILGTYIYDIFNRNIANAPLPTAIGIFNGLIALILMIAGNAFVKRKLHTSLW